VLRASSAFATKGQLKRRWMILNHEDGTFSCHEGPLSIHVDKGTLQMWKVNNIVAENSSIGDGKVLKFLGGNGNWTISFLENEPILPWLWESRIFQHVRL
jgi:predicted nuclease of restriction endonuclease-like (RecB) superfamily